jgi:hypothetical protein
MVKLRHRHYAEQDESSVHPPASEDAVDARQPSDGRVADSRAAQERRMETAHERTIREAPIAGERVATPEEVPPTAVAPVVQRPVTAPVDTQREAVSATTTETVVSWGPGQLLGLVVGVGMLILGTVALTRSGLDLNRLYSPHVEVAGLHHTPLLGVVEVLFGLLVIAASAVPGTKRGLLVLLGVVALGAGIVVMVATGTSLHDHLGVHRANGWLFVIDGALLVLAAMLPGARVRQVKITGRRRGMRVK